MISINWEAYYATLSQVSRTSENLEEGLNTLRTRVEKISSEASLLRLIFQLYVKSWNKQLELFQKPLDHKRDLRYQVNALIGLARIEGALAMLLTVEESERTLESEKLEIRLQGLREVLDHATKAGFISFNTDQLKLNDLEEMILGKKLPVLDSLLRQLNNEVKKTVKLETKNE